MKESLQLLKDGKSVNSQIVSFEELKDVVGFNTYYDEIDRYT